MNKITITIVMIIVFTVSGLYLILQNKSTSSIEIDLKDYSDVSISLQDYRGTPIVVNSWAIWCPFCIEELKDFAQVQDEAGDKIKIIAINRKENPTKVKNFIDELGIIDSIIFLLDSKDTFYREIGGFSMPETVFIDVDGNIVFHKRGPMTASELKNKIESEFGITI